MEYDNQQDEMMMQDFDNQDLSNIDCSEIQTIEGIKVNKQGKLYVSNPYLLKEILKSKERDELTSEAIQMFQLMIEYISSKKYYNDPMDREDCWQSAWEDIIRYWRGFDPEKTNNPFAYFTSLIINGMNKGWNKCAGKIKRSESVSLDNNIHSI